MPLSSPKPITVLLGRVASGDTSAQSELYNAVYEELRQIAQVKARAQGHGAILQPTALVNEAYLKLSAGQSQWDGRAHFFGAAGRAMRNIVVDEIRKRATQKHGGGLGKVELDSKIQGLDKPDPDRVLDVADALGRLEQEQPRAAKIVELRYFVGLADEETAEALEISVRTVFREWAFAKAWLSRELESDGHLE